MMPFTLRPYAVLGGRYRLVERIAIGGQGEVWQAEDITLGRRVAVKVLRSEYADSAEFRTRFCQEARHAGGLSHPGVAQVFDYDEGRDGTPPYLVMEYVDGESLSATIAREAPLSPDRVLDVIIATASALAAAHAAGLVHRDVKPGNLLLARDGSIKIADFGIARAVDAIPLTKTGEVMGTALYLAPEQASGMRATAVSDLYALGIIAYEMLTGRPPYEGPPTAVLLAHRDAPLPPLPPSVPRGLSDLIHALTAKDPARRPNAATAVVDWATQLQITGTAMPAPDATQRYVMPPPADRPGPPGPAAAGNPGPHSPGRRGSGRHSSGRHARQRPEGATQVLANPVAEVPTRHRWAIVLALGILAIALIAGIANWFAGPTAPVSHQPTDVPLQSAPPEVSPSSSSMTTAPVRPWTPATTPYPTRQGKHGKRKH